MSKKDKLNQEQIKFDIFENKKIKYNPPIYDCIEKYKYIGIDNKIEYLFEKDFSLNQCVISSDTGEEVDSIKLPLLSEISAGSPIYINEEYEEYFYIKDFSLNQCVISSDTGEEVDSIKLPLLSEISAGSPIYINEEYEEYFYIPKDVIRYNKDLFMLKVKGDSMIDAGISEISAGSPIYINEEYEEYFYIPKDVIRYNKDLFMLKVKGDSMIDAGIDDGDYVVIRKENNVSKKSIVAVEVDGHATLKRFEVQGSRLILIPENKNYDPIVVSVSEARIIGSAIGVIKCNIN